MDVQRVEPRSHALGGDTRGRVGLRVLGSAAAASFLALQLLDPYVRSHGGDASPSVLVLTALSLLSGLCLVAVGVLVGLRRELRWRRLGALPLIALGLFWSALPIGLAILATHPGEIAEGRATPSGVGLPFTAATIRTPDGTDLAAWYVPSKNGAALVMFPGAMLARGTMLRHAQVLARHGYGILIVDPRGHGASGGKAMEYGWYGGEDVGAAVDWLEKRPEVRGARIGALGLSMGAEQVLTRAAVDPRIKIVIAEGATHRTYEDVRRTLGGISAVLGVAQYRALFGVTELLTPASAPMPLEDAARDIAPRPVLLLNTKAEGLYGRRQRAQAPKTTTLWLPASEKHTKSLSEDRREWESRVVGFLSANL